MKHLGDITQINGAEIEPVDIITGGFPCQDLSVAGKREGLKGERSGLFYQFIRVVKEMREATNGIYPGIIVLENVPGLLSASKGQDFREVLKGLTESDIPMPQSGRWANHGVVRTADREVAWTILDARHFGVAQRRRRVFIICDFTKRCAAEILFEPTCLPGNPPQGGKAGKEAAGSAGNGVEGTGRVFYESGPGWISEGVGCLRAEGENRPSRPTHTVVHPRVTGTLCASAAGMSRPAGMASETDLLVAQCVTTGTGRRHDPETETLIPQPIPILEAGARTGKSTTDPRAGIGIGQEGDPMFTLQAGKQHAVAYGPGGQHDIAHALRAQASRADKPSSTTYVIQSATMSGDKKQNGLGVSEGPCYTLDCRADHAVATGYAVRRLLPIEAERLQGFPDRWTDIPGASDTARYKAIGNSLAIPCVEWIMGRIKAALDKPEPGSEGV
jgi:DNA (cytosine-5)-methyltransferase 1